MATNLPSIFIAINFLFILVTSKLLPLEDSTRYRLLLVQYLILAEALFILTTKFVYNNLVDRWPRDSSFGIILRLFLIPIIVLSQSCMLLHYYLAGNEPCLLSLVAGYCFGFVMYLIASVIIMETCFFFGYFVYKLKKRTIHGAISLLKTYKNKKEEFFYLISVLTLSFICFIVAHKHASRLPPIKFIRVPIKNLPKSFNNTTIVQLSDMHVGVLNGKTAAEKIVEISNSLKPDIVAMTGDIAEGKVTRIGKSLDPLKNLKAKYGVFVTTGNHDYYSADIDKWIEFWKSQGLNVLHNSKTKIINKQNDYFYLAGIDDTEGKFFRGGNHGPDYEAALQNRDHEIPTVLLTHRPSVCKKAITKYGNIQLALSGHTHGGQFPLSGLYHFLSESYFYGLNRYNDHSYVYVSTGVFYWAAPLRLISEGEIPHITLISSS